MLEAERSTLPADETRPKSARILLVEDDPDHRDTVREVLTEEGYSVDVASNGAAALAAMEQGPLPDLILLDLMMPVMDGWWFIDELRERPDIAQVPVVVMTGAGSHVLDAAPPSAAHIAKPLGRSNLLGTIASTLSMGGAEGQGSGPAVD